MNRPVLSVTVAPLHGESMTSWVDRLAARQRASVSEMVERLGISETAHYAAMPAGYGVALPGDVIAEVARVARRTESEIERLLLSSFTGRVLPQAWRGKAGVVDWVYQFGSHFCPSCLADDGGAWKLEWKLPWSFLCAKHSTWLLSHCAVCGARGGGQKGDRSCRPAFPTMIPQPGHCGAQRRLEGSRAKSRCGNDLTLSPDHQVANAAFAKTQRDISEAIARGRGTVAGVEVDGPEFFETLRAVAALWSLAGEPTDFESGDPAVDACVAGHISRRAEVTAARMRHYGTGQSHHTAPAMRHWGAVPTSPALVGALTHAALPIVVEMNEPALDVLADRLRAKGGAFTQTLRSYRIPNPIASELASRSQRVRRFTIKSGARRPSELEVRHIPTLFWQEPFAERLSRCFPREADDQTARRFASVAMARHLSGSTWEHARASTGNASVKSHSRLLKELHERGTETVFAAAIEALAEQLATGPDLIDFAERRHRYADWTINSRDWQTICAIAGVNVGKGARVLNASAWCWAFIVGGAWNEAPCWRDNLTENQREVYRRFVKQELGALADVLQVYVDSEIAGDKTAFDALPFAPIRLDGQSFADIRPDLVVEWDLVRNAPLTPETVKPKSERTVWWKCSTCSSSWRGMIAVRTLGVGPGCPSCSHKRAWQNRVKPQIAAS